MRTKLKYKTSELLETIKEKNEEIANLQKTIQELRCLLAAEESRLRAEKLFEARWTETLLREGGKGCKGHN